MALQSTPMARALLGEHEALAEPTFILESFTEGWLFSKPHYADQLAASPAGWFVWTYLPSGDPCWVADCPTHAEANALAESLSAPTLWEVHHV